MMATRVRLLDALMLAATVHGSLMSADDSTDNCHGDCGNDGVCAGDHYCSLIRGEPFCRPCSDIQVHYCHNVTYITDNIPQCLYYCRAENKTKILEQQLEARKTTQTADVWANPLFEAVFTVLLVALGAVVVLVVLYCRERRRRTANTEKESQPLMQPNSDTSQKEVVVDTEMLFSPPVSHPPQQSDVGYETSNASLKSTTTDNGSPALAVQHRTSKEDLNINPDYSSHAGCKQETGREVNLSDVTPRPSARRVIQTGVVNNPTSEDCKFNRNVVTNVSRHSGDDI